MAEPRTEPEPRPTTKQEPSSPPPKKLEGKASYKSLPDPGWKIKAGGWNPD